MKLNKKTNQYTHEGAKAKNINAEKMLSRSVLSCMLWENEFYEDGQSIADRIHEYAKQCSPEFVSNLAIKARTEYKLRHSSLWLAMSLVSRGGPIVSKTLYEVINRPDEITEALAMYWNDGKKPLSAQLKKGLALAFTKFDEYQISKWNRQGDIKLRDVMFLVHAKPGKDQEDLFKKLANKELSPADTWESKMAAGGDKKEVFTDLLTRNKLGYMALLRNLRGMLEVGVNEDLIKEAILRPSSAVLPYRFIAAAKHAPSLERQLDEAMLKILDNHEKLSGKTVILVDVSGSMDCLLSAKSDLKRIDAANGLAILLSSICDNIQIGSFSNHLVEVAPRRGMALADAIWNSQINGGTYLGMAVDFINKNISYDRLIVITDEQSRDPVPNPKGLGYMINVASNRNGIGYYSWVHIDGFSEACIDFIQQYERSAS